MNVKKISIFISFVAVILLLSPVCSFALADDLTPTMSDYTMPSGTVSASTYGGGNDPYPWKAFDKNLTSYWYTNGNDVAWIEYDFNTGTAPVVSEYGIAPIYDHYAAPIDFTFWGKNGNESWQLLDTQTGLGTGDWTDEILKIFPISNTTAYQKYKLDVTSASGDDLMLADVALYGTFGSSQQSSSTATSTSQTQQDQQNLFNAILIFGLSTFFVVWLFRR
jgi:hypothetical protein